MPKPTSVYVCSECGGESAKWAGQCPHCKSWNTLGEFKVVAANQKGAGRNLAGQGPRARPLPITQIETGGDQRRKLEWEELNRVLGGGIVAGSLVLVGGEPGVGKSTLLMHLARQVAQGGTVLYATGEESALQVRMRAGRLGAVHEGILLLAENDLEGIVDALREFTPSVAIVDSIQTVYDPGVEAAAGSISQVRDCAARLMRVAKETGIPIFLVGHVTKDGSLAGPRVLEHMVDTVLYLEGDRSQEYRILRATKNRFGSTDEIGIFTMGQAGLEEVTDPGRAFLSELSLNSGGTVVLAAVEGTRPLLVEIQSLVNKRDQAAGFPPRRSVNGVDLNRLHMITAVLEKRVKSQFGNADIFVNVVGGLKIGETAADLALALSLWSAETGRPLPGGTVVIGELGLTGEVRRVGLLERRLTEAARRGFTSAIIPRGALKEPRFPGLEIHEVGSINEAIGLFPDPIRPTRPASSFRPVITK